MRITPARAGKTAYTTDRIAMRRDHPRSCGKDTVQIENIASPLGSPPLVRERLADVAYSCIAGGITPARAGKTQCGGPGGYLSQDHPRSCGKDKQG